MTTLGHHVMLRCEDDRVLAPGPAQRRALARSIYKVAGDAQLLAFGAADTHLHMEVLGERDAATSLVQRVGCSLHWSLSLGSRFTPARLKPLADYGHQRSTFHYVQNQQRRHEVRSDPLMDATSLPDLLGMRVIDCGSLHQLVREQFPRLQRHEILQHLGLSSLEPATPDQLESLVRAGQHALLRDAAAGAVAVGALVGQRDEVVAARTALAQLLAPYTKPADLRTVIHRSSSVTRRTLKRAEWPRLQRAISLQISLRVELLGNEDDELE